MNGQQTTRVRRYWTCLLIVMATVMVAIIQRQGASAVAHAQSLVEPDAIKETAPTGSSWAEPGQATHKSSEAQTCQAEALRRPGRLAGRYERHTVPNDNWYQISFTLVSLQACDAEGNRTIRIFQQKQELGIGLRPKLEWLYNGLDTRVKTNRAKSVSVALRAYHGCWPRPVGAYGNFDKMHHIRARPAITETWTPIHGAPVSMTFTGSARPVCK
jgi:hypothetical protein